MCGTQPLSSHSFHERDTDGPSPYDMTSVVIKLCTEVCINTGTESWQGELGHLWKRSLRLRQGSSQGTLAQRQRWLIRLGDEVQGEEMGRETPGQGGAVGRPRLDLEGNRGF